jgi:transposase
MGRDIADEQGRRVRSHITGAHVGEKRKGLAGVLKIDVVVLGVVVFFQQLVVRIV